MGICIDFFINKKYIDDKSSNFSGMGYVINGKDSFGNVKFNDSLVPCNMGISNQDYCLAMLNKFNAGVAESTWEIYFQNEQDAKDAFEWIESGFLIQQLKNC